MSFTLEACNVLRDSPSGEAVLVETDEGDELWLPYSQVESLVRHLKPYHSSVVMTDWITKQKGLT